MTSAPEPGAEIAVHLASDAAVGQGDRFPRAFGDQGRVDSDGAEIVRQHAIYWPAFLWAAELPVPRQLVSHGWWLMEGAKMSKSVGNVVRPKDYIDRFGLDAFRYFVMREMPLGLDATQKDNVDAVVTPTRWIEAKRD